MPKRLALLLAFLPAIPLYASTALGSIFPAANAILIESAEQAESSRQSPSEVEEEKRRFLKAVAAYRDKRFAEALGELRWLLSTSPESFDVNELAGLVHVALGEDDKANPYLARAVRLNPRSAPARTTLATNLMRLHRSSEAEAQFRKAVELDPSGYDANHNLGEYYIQSAKLTDGVPYLRRAQQIDPKAYNNGYDLAVALLRTDKIDEARRQIQDLLKLQNTAELHSLLGEVEEKAKNYVVSAQQYELAAHMDPSESNIFNWGAELLLHQTMDPAIEVFKTGVQRYPHSARLYIGLGIAYYGRGHFDEGAEAFCQAADLLPTDPLPYTFLGKASQDVSPAMADQVRAKLRHYMELAPRDAAAHYYYALSLWHRDRNQQGAAQLTQVESLLKSALRLNPKYVDAYLQLGLLYAGQRNYAAAIDQYTRALKIDPNIADAHYRLGQALARTGETARAQQEFAAFERLHKQQVAETDKQRDEIQLFVYTLRSAEGTGRP
ncbi:MAG: tetratricopeptide repeat protein [Acidobacteriia bacterium]|nr:tetratricopeptide repeat protein [Terriglobia bacterium]